MIIDSADVGASTASSASPPARRAARRAARWKPGRTARPAGWRSGPTDVGWVVLLGGGAMLATGIGFGFAAFTGLGMAAAPAIGSAAAIHLARPRITVQRRLSANRVTVGEPVRTLLTVTNMSRF